MARKTGPNGSLQAAQEAADAELAVLAVALTAAQDRLAHLRKRVTALTKMRRRIDGWIATVDEEDRPLIVEEIGDLLDDLNRASAKFRRVQAKALAAEGATHERIARMFGVSRQRVSALLASDD